MGQNNDPAEHGEPQGQQGGPKISADERRRQSGYPDTPETRKRDRAKNDAAKESPQEH